MQTIYLDECSCEDPIAVHAAIKHADAEEGGEDDEPGPAVLHHLPFSSTILSSFFSLPFLLFTTYFSAK